MLNIDKFVEDYFSDAWWNESKDTLTKNDLKIMLRVAINQYQTKTDLELQHWHKTRMAVCKEVNVPEDQELHQKMDKLIHAISQAIIDNTIKEVLKKGA